MVSKILSIGDKTEITLKRNIKGHKKYFTSNVVDFVDEFPDRFIIGCPISYGKIVLLPDNEIYTLIFYTRSDVLSCDCKVRDHYKKDNLHFTLMEAISDFEKTQRREFFRISCLINFKYVKLDLDSQDHSPQQDVPMYNGIVKDLSGGGLRFAAADILEVDDYVQVVFPLMGVMVTAVGKIVLKSSAKAKSALHPNEYRLKFSSIERSEQEKIIKYIANEQRKYLQKTGFIRKLL